LYQKKRTPPAVSAASSAVVTRATLTEFYLTTVWEYKPKVVNQIIDELLEMENVSAFGVVCR
jgi:hypothetical protein